jgi:hypothetical protein
MSANTSIIFDIPKIDGASLCFYNASDSISTFHSAVRSVLKKMKNDSTPSPTMASTPTQSVSFAPFLSGQKFDNMSVSKMSDTGSKVAGLETRFVEMESQFSSSFACLETMLSGLGTQGLNAKTSSTGSNTTPVQLLANSPAPAKAGGSILDKAAGMGS